MGNFENCFVLEIPKPVSTLPPVPSPGGTFGAVARQTKLHAPQIELCSTIYRWRFYQISEFQAPLI